MRKHWIDNLRWVTVILVLLYHVIYFYNNKGVFGGVGGFGDGPQYQDTLMYVLYPWFMPLLFILAGVSARYSIQRNSTKKWFKNRTRKLLVPSTIGLLVFQWMTGYFNTHVAGNDVLDSVQQPVKFFAWAFSGIGPLWFIQDLWLFSLLLLLIRKITSSLSRITKCSKTCNCFASKGWLSVVALAVLGIILFWLGERTLIFNPRPDSMDGLWNLYKPVFYIIPFLLGYYVYSYDEVQKTLGKFWIPLMATAVISGAVLTITTFGKNNTIPQYLASPLNCIYGWLMCMAMMGWFKARFDSTNRFATYMTQSSFGLYIVHYLIIASFGYMMYHYTQLPPAAMYFILTAAVLIISPLLYEILHRIPIIRWCIFGEKGSKR